MFPEIHLPGNNLYLFPMMYALGCLLGAFVFLRGAKRLKIATKVVDRLMLMIPIIVLGSYASAIVFDKIAHWGEAPWYYPAGIAFAGGLIGGGILFLVFYPVIIKKPDRNLIFHLDLFAPAVIIGHCLGRIGCFLAGCCYGKPTTSFLGVVFPEDSYASAHYGHVAVFPTQLFEAGFLLILFFIVYYKIPKYYKTAIYLISYGVFRFFNEMLRGDNRGQLLPFLSPSQLWCLPILIVGIALLVYQKRISQKGA